MKYNSTWVLLLTFALCSCEKPRPTTYAPPTTEEASDEPDYRPKAPLSLDRTIRFIDYPLEMRVPERWDIRYDVVTILSGPTPNGPKPDGVIHLIVSRRGPLPKGVIDALKPPTTQPTTTDGFFKDGVRILGKLQVYEQRSVQAATGGVPAMVKWTISAYEPVDNENVRLYQINFLDLSRDQFEKDRELLESMIASLAPAEEESPTLK